MLRTILIVAAFSVSAAPTHAQANDPPKAWLSKLVRHIESFKRFPAEAKRRGETGRVFVRFTLDRSGNLIASRIDRSSCFDELDQEALATVQRAVPFPKFPAEFDKARANFVIPINFLPGKAPPPDAPADTRSNCLVS